MIDPYNTAFRATVTPSALTPREIAANVAALADYRAQLAAMFPHVSPAQLMRFDELVATDRLITDDGAPHPALAAWVRTVNFNPKGNDHETP